MIKLIDNESCVSDLWMLLSSEIYTLPRFDLGKSQNLRPAPFNTGFLSNCSEKDLVRFIKSRADVFGDFDAIEKQFYCLIWLLTRMAEHDSFELFSLRDIYSQECKCSINSGAVASEFLRDKVLRHFNFDSDFESYEYVTWKEEVERTITINDARLAEVVCEFLRQMLLMQLYLIAKKAELKDKEANLKFGAFLTQWTHAPDVVHVGTAFNGSLSVTVFSTLQNPFLSLVVWPNVKTHDVVVFLVAHCRNVSDCVLKSESFESFESRGKHNERASLQTSIAC